LISHVISYKSLGLPRGLDERYCIERVVHTDVDGHLHFDTFNFNLCEGYKKCIFCKRIRIKLINAHYFENYSPPDYNKSKYTCDDLLKRIKRVKFKLEGPPIKKQNFNF